MYPIILTQSRRQHNRLCIKGRKFSKYCNSTKTRGGGTNQPPPPVLAPCTRVRVRGCMYVSGLGGCIHFHPEVRSLVKYACSFKTVERSNCHVYLTECKKKCGQSMRQSAISTSALGNIAAPSLTIMATLLLSLNISTKLSWSLHQLRPSCSLRINP